MKLQLTSLAIGLFALLLVACNKDDGKKNEPASTGDVLICTSIVNPDGSTGSCYLQLIDGIDEASYSNANAYPFSFSVMPQVYNNWAFEASLMGEKQTLERYDRVEGQGLIKGPALQMSDGACACQMAFVSETKAYVSIWNKGKIYIINPTSMTKTGEIDIAEYGVEDSDPNPAGMVLRDDGLLFVSLNQIGGNQMPYPDRPAADVLIVDTETDKPLKMITHTASGLSYPSRPIDPRMMFIDEQGDIYVGCMGYFGFMPTHKSGFLRIKKGSQEFDADYAFTLPETAIEGAEHRADYLCAVQYAGNGQLYALLQCNSLHADPANPNYLADHTVLPVLMDLRNKTIKWLSDLPTGNNFGGLGAYNGKILFGLSSTKAKGFHVYDPATGKGTPNPVISTTGEPFFFAHLGERW